MKRLGFWIILYIGLSTPELVLCSMRDSPRHTINNIPPQTKTEYGLKTIQTGSVYIPPQHKGGPVHVGPDHNLTKMYISRVDTTVHHLPHRIYRDHGQFRRLGHHRSIDCVRCPTEKVLIAERGLDGVMIEPPRLISCRNRLVSNSAYQLETLFGKDFNFLLPHGAHSLHGRIRNKRSGRHEKTCLLRYKVVVQQCGRYYPQNPNVRVKCDIGSIWGSKCFFVCKKGRLSHRRPIVCSDELKWEGDEPECVIDDSQQQRNTCTFLAIPDNGRFSCQYNHDPDAIDLQNPEFRIPDGSICRIKCNRNYEIPTHLEPFNVFRCANGQWNTTINDLCQLKIRN